MIFAAGLGTRLLPLTHNLPKALAPLRGKPLLYYVIQKLWKSDIYNIVINVHHCADQIHAYLKQLPKPCNARFYISDEQELLRNTGGGLTFAMRQYGEIEEDWLVHNVDIWSNYPLSQLISQHQSHKAPISMLVQARPSSRYLLFDHNQRLQGWCNSKTQEKLPENITVATYHKMAFNGIHIANTSILNQLPTDVAFPLIPAYIKALQNISIQGIIHNTEIYKDLGKIEALNSMETYLQNHDL